MKDSQRSNTSDGCVIQLISADKTRFAIQVLVRLVQKTCFPKELHSLSSQGRVHKNSHILRLNPFIDEDGILRVGVGRVHASTLPQSAKYPILLPGRHPLSHLIVMHEHERHCLVCWASSHIVCCSAELIGSYLHEIWFVKLLVKLWSCIICFQNRPKTASTIMGDLPKARITVLTRVFESCGVDYAGPFYYKVGSRRATTLIKCYMAIFVCFASYPY